MICLTCKNGEYKDGTTNITLERGRTVVVIRNIEANVCNNCGDATFSSKTAKMLDEIFEEAVESGKEVTILELQTA